ncbi:hypothetical protein [Pseudolysinimonas sp.]|uniref:hypothetical protein n=1 Tax=Pseudolysinimonas sp. TaxID=2680009 RepID=UPI0037848535
MRRTVSILVMLAAAGLFASCTSVSAEVGRLSSEQIKEIAETAEENGWVEQADALRDGQIESVEYLAAYDRFAACLVARGYPAPETWTSPIDGFGLIIEVDAGGRSEDQKGQDVLACQDRYYGMVQGVYESTTPYDMDEGIRLATLECLRDRGYDVSGEEDTPAEMAGPEPLTPDGSNSERWSATITCLQDAQFELFPEIPTAVVAYL